MIILALLILYPTGNSYANEVRNHAGTINITLLPNQTIFRQINYSNNAPSALFVFASKPINVYLLNSTIFQQLQHTKSKNLSDLSFLYSEFPITIWHENVYRQQVDTNTTYTGADIFPNTTRINESLRVNSGASNMIYLVLDNSNGSASEMQNVKVSAGYLVVDYSIGTYVALIVISFVIGILGVIFFFYGALKK